MEEKPFEPVPKIRPGDEVLRRRREPRRRLRLAPNVPTIIRVLGDMVTRTPFVPMLCIVVALWLFFSTGFYFAEHGAIGSGINHYSEALWWGVVAMTTMGTAPMPVSGAGQIVGAIWAILGCIIFYGTIIAAVTSYFMLPRRRPTRAIISTVQYNLEALEDLSLEELETLKEVSDGLIDAQIGRFKKQPPQG